MDEIETEDEMLAEARDDLWEAIEGGKTKYILAAIEAMIDVKVAMAVEQLADRAEEAIGVRP